MNLTKRDQEILDEFKSKIKSNSNNYPIISKWNNRVFRKYCFKLFDILYRLCEEYYSYDDWVEDLVDVSDFKLGAKDGDSLD